MLRSGLVLLLVSGLACKSTAPNPQKDQPPAAVGSGSGSGSAAVVVKVPVDATPPPAPVAVAITIGKDGLSVMPNYRRTGKTDEEVVPDLQAKLAALPGLKVGFDVMEYADEREEGYFSVKQGETEVAQMFRLDLGDKIDVRVLSAMFPTADGIRVGDKASTLFAKHPEVTCSADAKSELGLLQCRAGKDDLLFLLDADGYKGKRSGKLATADLAERPIFMIAAGD